MGFFQSLGSMAGSFIQPGWGTAVGTGLGSSLDDLVSNIFSHNNDRKARAWQEAMYDKQFANNRNFWYEQQNYNSPKNQVLRLKEAGINPAFALGNIQSGQMGSVGTSSVPSASVSARTPAHRLNDTLSGLFQIPLQKQSLKEQVKSQELDNEGKEIDLQTRLIENLYRLNDLFQSGRVKESTANKNFQDFEIAKIMAMPNFHKVMSEIQRNITSSQVDTIEYLYKIEELKYLPMDKKILYMDKMSEIENRYLDGELTKQQTLTEIEKTNHEYFKSQGQKFVNSLNKKTEQYVIDKAQKDSRSFNLYDLGSMGHALSRTLENTIFKPFK